MRPGFEGGQMPIYMRLGKQRGQYSRDAMPVGPHRTRVHAVNVRDLERFDGEVTLEMLKEAGLIRNTRLDVKILGHGDLTKKLTVSAHLFSASAREKIEGAGGSITWLRGEPKPRPPKRREDKKPAPPPAEEPAAEAEEAPADEAPAEEVPAEEAPTEGEDES
jgi:ribosomal protein L15